VTKLLAGDQGVVFSFLQNWGFFFCKTFTPAMVLKQRSIQWILDVG